MNLYIAAASPANPNCLIHTMTDPVEQVPPHNVRLWKLGAYFLLLALFAVLNIELFRELGKNSYFEGFLKIQELLSTSFDIVHQWDDVIVTLYSLLMAFIFVLPIGWVYILTKEEEGLDPSMAQTLVVLGLVVCGVMMLVQDNLARAFGLVGIVAAVRYRNTLRDAKDAVYVFLAIGVGMACGLRVYHIAVLLSLTISGVFILLWKFRIGRLGVSRPVAIDIDSKKKLTIPAGMQGRISTEVRQQIEQELEMQARLWNLAGLLADKGRGIKRPNAALIVSASNPVMAQQLIQGVLDAKDQQWHLANIFSRGGLTTFEYLGRLNKKEPLPASLIEELEQQGRPYITGIIFRSLRGFKNAKLRQQGNGDEEGREQTAEASPVSESRNAE